MWTVGIVLLCAALVGRYLWDIPPRKHIRVVEAALGHERPRERALGPLRVLQENPRYFATPSGEPVLLVGSHTWANFNDEGFDPPEPFDYEQYLAFLERSNHNFFRLWAWEQTRWGPWVDGDDYVYRPGSAYRRTGPGSALDGEPKFNLDLFDEAHFERMRARAMAAGTRGIYVSIMLFNGWAIDNRHVGRGNPWRGHPFNRANNVNGVDGDPNGDESGEETHQLVIPRVTAYQERYVGRVIDAVNDLDNVLYEISNESYPNSRDWQYHMIRFIHEYEAMKGRRHPVGMTSYVGLNGPHNRVDRNPELFASEADWISPNNGLNNEYATDPPPARGGKVIVLDTDHIWGIGGDRVWAWKAFLRGYNLLFMDGYDGAAVGSGAPADSTSGGSRGKLR
jgi:hypothetical protein